VRGRARRPAAGSAVASQAECSLQLHVSTYSHDLDGLLERLAGEGERLRHVRGLVYQIRKG